MSDNYSQRSTERHGRAGFGAGYNSRGGNTQGGYGTRGGYGARGGHGNRGGYGSGQRNNYVRINPDEVPESKHCIFIKGLPANTTNEQIKNFFEDHIGPCSFDYQKVNYEAQSLFVGVRFENKDHAKRAFKRYQRDDILGCRCDVSWFRDIRRYVAYQQERGGLTQRGSFGRGRGFSNNNNKNSRVEPRKRRYSAARDRRSRSRSCSESDRSRSRSPRRYRRRRSESPARSKSSRASSRSSRSSSRSSDRRSHSRDSGKAKPRRYSRRSARSSSSDSDRSRSSSRSDREMSPPAKKRTSQDLLTLKNSPVSSSSSVVALSPPPAPPTVIKEIMDEIMSSSSSRNEKSIPGASSLSNPPPAPKAVIREIIDEIMASPAASVSKKDPIRDKSVPISDSRDVSSSAFTQPTSTFTAPPAPPAIIHEIIEEIISTPASSAAKNDRNSDISITEVRHDLSTSAWASTPVPPAIANGTIEEIMPTATPTAASPVDMMDAKCDNTADASDVHLDTVATAPVIEPAASPPLHAPVSLIQKNDTFSDNTTITSDELLESEKEPSVIAEPVITSLTSTPASPVDVPEPTSGSSIIPSAMEQISQDAPADPQVSMETAVVEKVNDDVKEISMEDPHPSSKEHPTSQQPSSPISCPPLAREGVAHSSSETATHDHPMEPNDAPMEPESVISAPSEEDIIREEMKEREKRTCGLDRAQKHKFETKMKLLMASYKGDAGTISQVASSLVQKDPSLEDRIKPALQAVLGDLEKQLYKKVDDWLDFGI